MAGQRHVTGQPSTRISRKDLKPKKPQSDAALLRQAARNARAHQERSSRLTPEQKELAAIREARRSRRSN